MTNTQTADSFFIGLIVRETQHRFVNSGIVGSVKPEWIVETYQDIARDLKFDLTEDHRTLLMNLIRSKIDVPLEGSGAISIVDDDNFEKWYTPSLLGKYWGRFKKYIEDKGSIPDAVKIVLDEDTDKILTRMANPRSEKTFNCRGMVVGDVQAGKTLNYSGLINKACDVGYHVIIVLTGTTEDLRSQTQERLDEDFVGQLSRVGNQQALDSASRVGVGHINWQIKPFCLTDVVNDFKRMKVFSIDSVNEPILIVAKKNVTVLDEINSWINTQKKDARDKVQKPFLIIDDEADNASVNTGKADEDPKKINHSIRRILESCARITYVGYTATPFANIFISPDDSFDSTDLKELFPKDFIFSLVPPPNYCGGRFFFLNPETSDSALEFIRDADKYFPASRKKQQEIVELPPSLIRAIRQFFIASAMKDIRRKSGDISDNLSNRFDSMLINISTLVNVQNTVKPLVKDEVDKISQAISANQLHRSCSDPIVIDLINIYDKDFLPSLDKDISWESVATTLLNMDPIRVVSINGDSDDVLKWKEDSPKKNIAIGGLTLSRGLTLNGLVISYLFRNSKMFDTIMQMGRWFGYRDGYRDLLRLWCSPDVADAYQKATLATEEVREDIKQMNRQLMKPRDFGMKVAAYPGLMPTAKNKMRLGVTITHKVSFSDKKRETYFFNRDEEVEKINNTRVLEFARTLQASNDSKYVSRPGRKGKHKAFLGVSSDLVIPLLVDFKYHRRNKDLPEKYFRDYLEELRYSELSTWNVIFYSRQTQSVDVGISKELSEIFGEDINSQERSLFLKMWIRDRDTTCVPLSANCQLSTGDIDKLAPNRNEPTLIIHSIKVWDPTPHITAENPMPAHLEGLKGHEFYGITILFPCISEDSQAVTCIATQDYVKRYFGDDFDA
jgi:hypothetical protein